MSKYKQLESTKYKYNEFDDMPSLDYGHSSYRATKRNWSDLDWDKVIKICNKHGFTAGIINSTFGGDERTVVIYRKTGIDRNAWINRKDWREWVQLKEPYEHWIDELHQCVHELDLETNLYLEAGWLGTSNKYTPDTSSKGYRRIDFRDDRRIFDIWSPTINDTTRTFGRGVYVMVDTNRFKIKEEDRFPEFTMELALQKLIEMFPDLDIKIAEGRRQCDGDVTYKAIVVNDKKGCQLGSLTFYKDEHDIVGMSRRVPLCGESSWNISKAEFEEELRDAIKFMI